MKLIELTKGQFAKVDDEFFEELNQHEWCLHSKGYAYRQVTVNGKQKPILMHREVMRLAGRDPGLRTDHRNRDRLDNQLHNLRAATGSQNAANAKVRVDSTTGVTGVSQYPGGRFIAYIKVNYKKRHLGIFDTKIEAMRARDAAAVDAWQDFASLALAV